MLRGREVGQSVGCWLANPSRRKEGRADELCVVVGLALQVSLSLAPFSRSPLFVSAGVMFPSDRRFLCQLNSERRVRAGTAFLRARRRRRRRRRHCCCCSPVSASPSALVHFPLLRPPSAPSRAESPPLLSPDAGAARSHFHGHRSGRKLSSTGQRRQFDAAARSDPRPEGYSLE